MREDDVVKVNVDQRTVAVSTRTEQGGERLPEPAFALGLAQLDERIELVPFGWQHLYLEVRAGLRAARCESRMGIQIYGPTEEEGQLYLDANGIDPVVHGLLRKARARARCTCMDCGRPGFRRQIRDSYKTLCGRCAGHHFLADELPRLLRMCGDGTEAWLTGVVPLTDLTPRERALVCSFRDLLDESQLGVDDDQFVSGQVLRIGMPTFAKVLDRVRAEICS